MQMQQVHALAKKLQENQTKNQTKRKAPFLRSSTFPETVENSPTTKRSLSCGDTVPVGKDLELAGEIPKAKQEDNTNRPQETRL